MIYLKHLSFAFPVTLLILGGCATQTPQESALNYAIAAQPTDTPVNISVEDDFTGQVTGMLSKDIHNMNIPMTYYSHLRACVDDLRDKNSALPKPRLRMIGGCDMFGVSPVRYYNVYPDKVALRDNDVLRARKASMKVLDCRGAKKKSAACKSYFE